MSIRDKYCVVGVGNTRYGKLPGRSAESLTVEAIRNAIEDCGIEKRRLSRCLELLNSSDFGQVEWF